jgi:hypothetical protein
MSWATVLLYLFFLVFWLTAPGSGSVIEANGQGQTTDVQVVERDNDWQCPSMEKRDKARNIIHQIANSAILLAAKTATGHIHTCNGTPGWRHVVFINMTNTSYNCPTGLNLTSYMYSKRTCGRPHTSQHGCSSTTFTTGGLSYSRVCGRIRGYQVGSTSAFRPASSQDIDNHYVDGVSLTHGGAGRRQHIWTFAVGLSENTATCAVASTECCPCDTAIHGTIPTFIGNDYFCESGLHSAWNRQYGVFHSDDVLWDGQNCTSTSTCCQLNNPPWFTKNLPNATTDDIELRICAENQYGYEDVAIELIELYVQ